MERRKSHGFFQGASRVLFLVLAAFLLGVVYARVSPPTPSLGNLLAVSKLLVQLLLFGLAVLVGLRLLARLPSRYLFLVACTLGVVFYHFGRFEPWGLFWTAFFAIVPATLLGGSLRISGRRASVLRAVGGGGLVFALVYFLRSGSPAPLPVNAALEAGAPNETIAIESPRTKGPYAVERLTYGSGADRHRPEFGAEVDVRTEPVDGTKLIEGWEGRSGWARTQYWGFDASALPLQGRVFLPRGEGPFPLVLVVHGNHAMEDFSDTGYGYLGELLASRGVVMVSVDENFINSSFSSRLDELYGRGLRTENDARGWLLLKHLEQWRRWNEDGDGDGSEANPFFGKIDMERIGLIGHSRGGEAVAVAAFFNGLDRYPDDASLEFDFGFRIRGVVAIAPVDGQYEPAGRGTPIRNTNYFVLHGSHDGDVQSFAGSRQLERVVFDDGAFHFKASLYVAGANHGQFNTSWGRSDASFPSKNVLNLTPIMPEEEQRAIAQTFIAAFFEIVLEDEARYLPLFRDWRSGRPWLPTTVLLTHYRDSTERVIADFDEDLDVTTTTLAFGSLRGEGLSTWKERLVELKYGDKGTNAVHLAWGDDEEEDDEADREELTPAYVVALPDALRLGPDDAIVFALADARDEPGDPIDLTIELGDGDSRASMLLSRLAPVQPRIRVQVAKSAWFNETPTSEPIYQSYTLPLSMLQGIDPGALREIRFVFDRAESGAILLDDLGIRPARTVDPASAME